MRCDKCGQQKPGKAFAAGSTTCTRCKKLGPKDPFDENLHATLQEIATELGITRMGALKIIRRALDKVKATGVLQEFHQ